MMSLWFESGEDSLSVRQFSVLEGVSTLFEVDIVTRSPNEALDLEAILGRSAAFQLGGASSEAASSPLALDGSSRTFLGVCSAARQTRVERSGLSTYELRILPHLWLLTQRTNHRVFQHLSIPEIVTKLLAEWSIEARWNVDRQAHPRLEYRVQYGESDFSFLSRLLEEAGIVFTLGNEPGGGGGAGRGPVQTPTVSFFERLASGEPRAGGPIPFKDNPDGSAGQEYVTRVEIAHELRPGKVALQGFDFRRKVDAPLVAVAELAHSDRKRAIEARLEQHVYSPAAFFAEKAASEGRRGAADRHSATPVADDRGTSRAEEKIGRLQAERRLATARAGGREIKFATNVSDLAPGTLFTIEGHGHSDLGSDRRLLVTHLELRGSHDGQWSIDGKAVFADVPYLPPKVTPKPVVQGVESAIVVGPPNEDIHTDEFGRVRVQFPWDREGELNDSSSCWIRVSQGWAGAGYGILALPRVGQEVVVSFFGGDPDQPVIVGQLFNQTSPVPQKLPEGRTATTWRSSSSPGGQGWNEITLEDEAGRERVFVQAQRDFVKVVKADESSVVGGDRARRVDASETVEIRGGQSVAVGEARSVSVGRSDDITVGESFAVNVRPSGESAGALSSTGLDIAHRKITLTTGEATITLEGPNITLDAAAAILLNAAADITINGRANIHIAGGAHVLLKSKHGDLIIEGGPDVFINPREGAENDPAEIPVDAPLDLDMAEEMTDAEDFAMFDPDEPESLQNNLAAGGAWDPLRWGPDYEEFGFFQLGVTAAAAGIPLGVMMRQKGKRNVAEKGASEERGDPGNGVFGGKAPFGNDPREHELMVKGAKFHARNYGQNST